MPIVRDIKNRDTKKTLNLNKGNSSAGKVKKGVIDLNCNKIKTRRLKKIADVSGGKSGDYLLFSKKHKDYKKPSKGRTELMRFIVLAIIIFALFNLFNIGAKVAGIAKDVQANAVVGLERLVKGGQDAADMNLGGAVQYFDSASYSFGTALDEIWFLKDEIGLMANDGIGSNGYLLLRSGENISNAASYFSQGVSVLNEIPVLFLSNNTFTEGEVSSGNVSITEKLKSTLNIFDTALDEIKEAKKGVLKAGPGLLPVDLREHYNMLVDKMEELVVTLDSLKIRVPAILSMLGDRYPHRYLVLLQNNTESRPTGGFIGSFLIVDVNDGYITKADFHDVYEYDGQLHEFIQAPAEIAELTSDWRMRDANYSPDFSISAKKIAWFLEKEGGPGVDSVIAINQSLLGDLLEITGPIEVEGLSAPLTAENYNIVLTYIVESKIEGEENPKAVISRILPALQAKLYEKGSVPSLLSVIETAISEKQILAWSKNDYVQQFFEDVDISGQFADSEDSIDFFNMVSINIGGNKSDQFIKDEIVHESLIGANGEIRDLVSLNRRHIWNPSVLEAWKEQLKPFGMDDLPEWFQDILGRGANKSVIKIYVPKGTRLENITGIDREFVTEGYDEELNKNYIYFTLEVAAGSEAKVTLNYVLEEKMNFFAADKYNINVLKQPGNLDDVKFVKRIHADTRLNNYKNYPHEVVYKNGEAIEYETTLKTDQYFSSLFGLE